MPIFCDAHALMLACVRKNDLEECAASRDSGLAPGWSWCLCLMVVTCNSFCQTEGASPQLVCSHKIPYIVWKWNSAIMMMRNFYIIKYRIILHPLLETENRAAEESVVQNWTTHVLTIPRMRLAWGKISEKKLSLLSLSGHNTDPPEQH